MGGRRAWEAGFGADHYGVLFLLRLPVKLGRPEWAQDKPRQAKTTQDSPRQAYIKPKVPPDSPKMPPDRLKTDEHPWVVILLVVSLLGRISACGEPSLASLVAILLVMSILSRNSASGEHP